MIKQVVHLRSGRVTLCGRHQNRVVTDEMSSVTCGSCRRYARQRGVRAALNDARIADRVQGGLFGCAIGDALGYPVEFMPLVGGVREVTDCLSEGFLFSDDTQMYVATMEGLLDAGPHATLDVAALTVAQRYVEWARSPENNRAPGGACMLGCHNLGNGTPWQIAGKAGDGAGGCGAAMRAGAYGLRFGVAREYERANIWAGLHARMTHQHPMAQASSAAIAVGVAKAFHATSLADVARAMVEAARWWDFGTATMLEDAIKFAAAREPARVVLDRWRGWAGHEAVAAALYCVLLEPEDWRECALLAINSPGDSDSIGAIAGTLLGTWLGYGAIPPDWTKRVEKADKLADLSDRFTRLVLP